MVELDYWFVMGCFMVANCCLMLTDALVAIDSALSPACVFLFPVISWVRLLSGIEKLLAWSAGANLAVFHFHHMCDERRYILPSGNLDDELDIFGLYNLLECVVQQFPCFHV